MKAMVVVAWSGDRGGWYVVAREGEEYGEAGPYEYHGRARARALVEAFKLASTAGTVEVIIDGRTVELREVG